MPTRLQFDKEHSIIVDEDLNTVERVFEEAAKRQHLAEFTFKGEKLFVNVSLIRFFAEVKERSGKANFL